MTMMPARETAGLSFLLGILGCLLLTVLLFPILAVAAWAWRHLHSARTA